MRDVEHERRRVSLTAGPARDETRLARRETQSAGLVAFLAQHCNRRGIEERRGIGAHHSECVLGTSRFRTSGIERTVAENWRRWIDTALDPPHEICEWNAEPVVPEGTYRVGARSVVVLIAGDGRMPDISTGVQS